MTSTLRVDRAHASTSLPFTKRWEWGKQIDVIVDQFDFRRVHKAMKALGWTYRWENHSPTIDQLKTEAENLLWETADGQYSSLSRGGFRVHKKDGVLELSFVVESVRGVYP